MKPRVFVSSTYYDLKHIRNNLENFIKSFGFEPVLFESSEVIFEHDKPLDESCYKEVKNCHMMILIIGGRYGSPKTEDLEKINDNSNAYMSITRAEFKTAIEENIPIFIFIDKNVYSEYHTFKENRKLFKQLAIDVDEKTNIPKLKFAFVDSLNVFEFIDEIRGFASKGKAIWEFEKFEHIEQCLRSQWAGMFYLYLNMLRDKNRADKVFDAVTELRSITEQMNSMLKEVGKRVIEESEYKEILIKQNEITIENFARQIVQGIYFDGYMKLKLEDNAIPHKIALIILEEFLDNELLERLFYNYSNLETSEEYIKILKDIDKKLKTLTRGNIELDFIEQSTLGYYFEGRELLDEDNNRELFILYLSRYIRKKIEYPF